MKTKVYYCCTKDGRGYWKLWSNQDECNYMYSTKVAPYAARCYDLVCRGSHEALNHFEFQEVVHA